MHPSIPFPKKTKTEYSQTMTMKGNSLRTLVTSIKEKLPDICVIFVVFLSMDPNVKHYNCDLKYFNLLVHYILIDECRDVDKFCPFLILPKE